MMKRKTMEEMMQYRKRGMFFKGRFQRAFLLAGIVFLSMCTAVCADPAGCPQPSETDAWQYSPEWAVPPELAMEPCQDEFHEFTVHGLYPPYRLELKTGGDGWEYEKYVESKFVHPCLDKGNCVKARIMDARGLSSNEAILDEPDFLQYGANPDEVNPNIQTAVTISITGGVPPYIWTASGEGFSFATAVTTERSNTLLVTTDACGAGRILVEDVCEQFANGSIRSTNGQWVLANSCGEEIGPGGSVLAQNWCSSLQPDHYLVSPTEGWTFTKILYRVYKEPEYWNQCEKAPCEIPGYPNDPGEGYKISTRYIHKFHWECP